MTERTSHELLTAVEDEVRRRSPAEPEFLQTVHETLTSLAPSVT